MSRIKNPFPVSPNDIKIYGRIPPHINDYFFNHVFAGDCTPGRESYRQSIINILLNALYDECRKSIPAVFDPDNDAAVAAILERINFNPVPVAIPIPIPKRNASRRSTVPTPVSPTQPIGDGDVGLPASRPRPKAPRTRKQPANVERKD